MKSEGLPASTPEAGDRIGFECVVMRSRIDVETVPMEAWKMQDFPALGWEAEAIDPLIRSLFAVVRCEERGTGFDAEAGRWYECSGGEGWDGVFKQRRFEIQLFRDRRSMAFCAIPGVLLARFLCEYHRLYAGEQGMAVFVSDTGAWLHVGENMTAGAFLRQLKQAC